MDAHKTSFYRYTLPELQELFVKHNLHPSGPGLLYNWHYKKRRTEPCVDDLAKISRDFVSNNFDFFLPVVDTVKESADKTVKFLFAMKDGLKS